MGLDAGLATLGAAAISAGGQYFTNVGNSNLNKNNRDWQERINREAREYNLPINQKARLQAAGINPYSVMAGEGADIGNSNAEGESAPSAIPFQNPISNNVALDLIQGMKLASEKEGQDIANDQARVNLAFSETEKFLGLRKTMAEIKNLLSSEGLNNQEREYLQLQYSVYQAQAESIIKKSRAEANQAQSISENLQREYDDRHFDSVAKRQSIDAGIRLSNAQIHNLGVQENEIYQRILNLNEERNLTKQQINTEIEKQATEVCNRVLGRSANKREWKRLQKEVIKDLNDMIGSNDELRLPGGSLRLPQLGNNKRLIDDWSGKGVFDFGDYK